MPALEYYSHLFPNGPHSAEVRERLTKFESKEAEKRQKVGPKATYIRQLGIFVREMTAKEIISVRGILPFYDQDWPGGLLVIDVFGPRQPDGLDLKPLEILCSFGPPIAASVEQEHRNRLLLVRELELRVGALGDPYLTQNKLQWAKMTAASGPYTTVGGPLLWDEQVSGIIDPWGRLK